MLVAYLRAMGDMGLTSVPGFSDPASGRLLSGPLWRAMLQLAQRLARGPSTALRRDCLAHVDGLVLRVAFIDAVIAQRAPRQVVIVGAGLDTRAYRLTALAGVRVFEVDHPDTQAFKRHQAERLGPPRAELRYVPLDFRKDALDEALRAHGFDGAEPTLWVWEGVVMYLDDHAVDTTLAAMRRLSAPGSTLLVHYHEREPHVFQRFVRFAFMAFVGEPHIGLRTQANMHAALERAGFRVLEDAGVPEQATRVGARADLPVHLRVSRIVVAT
jgi:methyltransferase (TIGR00027 family)